MRIEVSPRMTNVVRFPVERRARPTLALLRDIAPDVREVLAIVVAFGFEAPPSGLRSEVDLATAEHIIRRSAAPVAQAPGGLDELLQPVVARAIESCRLAHDLSLEAAGAQRDLLAAQIAGSPWLRGWRDRAEGVMVRAAKVFVEAHVLAERAEGVARAVGFARRGEAWLAPDRAGEAGVVPSSSLCAG